MSFSTTRRVEFRDTDAAGIVHFSAFFPMMEAAEHEMLRSLGLSVLPKDTGESGVPAVTWPRVSASCNYASAAQIRRSADHHGSRRQDRNHERGVPRPIHSRRVPDR